MATQKNVIENSAGSVGIGTTSPTQVLELKKTTGSAIALLNYNDSVKFNINASSAGAGYVGMVSNHPLLFVNNDTERMRIDTNGNLGIGTSSPTQKLEVAGFVMGGTSSYRTSIGANASGAYIYFGDTSNLYSLGRLGTYNSAFNINSYNGPISFQISDSEKVRIDSNGNVGIGTTSPSGKLHVYDNGGSFRTDLDATYHMGILNEYVSTYVTRTKFGRWNNTSNLEIYYDIAGLEEARITRNFGQAVLKFNRSSTTDMIIDGSGNVGIGTTSPSSTKLHIVGDWASGHSTVKVQGITDNTTGYGFYDTAGSRLGYLAYTGAAFEWYNNANVPIIFYTNTSEKMRIASGGNVGIGTTSPAYKLEVNGSARFVNIIYAAKSILSDSSGVNPVLEVYNTVATNATTAIIRQTTAGGNGNQDIGLLVDIQGAGDSDRIANFRYYDGSTYTSRMAILRSGNVGIGTSSPSVKLDIASTQGDGIVMRYDTSTAYQAWIRPYWNSGTDTRIDFAINRSANVTPTVIMSVGYGSNVGIGTTSPGYKLDVYGDLRISGSTSTIGTFKSSASSCFISLIDSSGDNVFLGNDDGDFLIQTPTSAYSTKLIVKDDGNVGIGTTSPTALLHVRGASFRYEDTSNSSVIQIGPMANNYPYVRFDSYISDNSGYLWGFGQKTAAGATRVNAFFNDNNRGWYSADQLTVVTFTANEYNSSYPTFSEPIKLRASGATYFNGGNVGIGTTSPVAPLDVSKLEYPSLGGVLVNFSAGTTTPTTEKYVLLRQTYTGAGYDSPMLAFRANANASNQNSFGTIRTTSNGSIVFSNVNASSSDVSAVSEKVRIDSNGNVGIGTSSPGAKLDVNGDVYISPNTAGKNTFILSTNASNDARLLMRSDTTTKVDIQANGTSYFNGGNVGIGTSTASGLLSLHGTYPQIIANNPTTGSGVVIQLRDNGRDAGFMGHSTTTARLQFGSKGSNAAHMTISEAGDVGIGTTAPTAQSNYRFLQVNGTNSAIIETMVGGSRIGGFDSSATALYVGSIGSYPIVFRTAVNEKMRLDTNGNLGIGTSSPATLLHVDTSGADARIRVSAGTNTVQGGMIANSGTSLIYAGSITNHGFSLRTNDTDRVRIDTSGNVGIGTTSPSTKLVASGDATDSDVGQFRVVGSTSAAKMINVGYHTTNNYGFIQALIAGTGYSPLSIQPNGGNVGIGTTSPSSRLQLGNLTSTSTATPETLSLGGTFSNSAGSNIKLKVYDDGAAAGGMSVSAGQMEVNTWSSGKIAFYRGTTQTAIIDNNGNVGVGTSSPSWLLTVYAATAPQFTLQNGTRSFVLTNNSADNLLSFYYNSANRLQFDTTNQWFNSGNVGIGTTSPGNAKLHIYDATYSFTRCTNTTNAGHYVDIGANQVGQSFLFSYGAYPVLIGTNGSERIRILSDGNVGIGTSSPAQKLHVVGAVYGTTYGQFGTAVASGTNASFAVFGSNSAAVGVKLVLDSDVNRNDLVVATTGNIGIGTSTPGAKLNTYASGSNLSVFKVDGGNGTLFEVTDNLSGSLFSVNDVSGLPLLEVFSNNRIVAGKYGSNALVVSGSSVGIGTTSPAAKLHVVGTSSTNENVGPLFVTHDFSGTHGYGIIVSRDNSVDTAALSLGADNVNNAIIASNNTDLRIGKQQSSTLYEYVRINTSGNVGIGTSSPNTLLNVRGTNPFVRIDNSSGGDQGIKISYNNSDTHGLHLLYNPNSAISYIDNTYPTSAGQVWGDVQIRQNIGGTMTTRMTIKADGGSVGIGTTSPTGILNTAGSGDQVVRFIHTDNTAGRTVTLRLTNNNATYLNSGTYIQAIQGAGLDYYSLAFGTTFNSTTSTEKMRIQSDGNVGIGTTSAIYKFHVKSTDTLPVTRFELSTTTGGLISYFVNSNASGYSSYIYIGSSPGTDWKIGKNIIAAASNSDFQITDHQDNVRLHLKAADGNIGIGTTTPAYKLQVNGSFAATTKSFIIQHPDPSKSDKQLVHGVLEGPEHSVFVRGILKDTNIIQLPDYWQHLVHEDSVSVTLTSNKYYQQLYVKNVTLTTIEVGSETDKPINCYYYIVGERKDIDKLIPEI